MGGFALYAIYYGSSSATLSYLNPTTITSVKNKNTTNTKTIKSTSSQNQTPIKNTTPKTNGGTINNGIFKNGEFTGDSADAYYGYVQVKVVISNGRLSDVIFLDYPQDRGNSIRINNEAMPILKSEAIKAQSSNVNIVSGATDSSGAFKQSLASALAQAKI